MMVDKQKAQQQHSKFLFDVAVQIEKLVNEPAIMTRFRDQIQTLCKMVVSYYSQPGKKNKQNPLDWFRPKASLSQPLSDKNRMMVNYVMLIVIHDNMLRPQWQRIYYGSDNIETRPHFDFDIWANGFWPWLRVWSDDRNKQHIEIYADSIREAETIRAEIRIALEQVQANLAKVKPAETEQNTAPAKDLSKELEKPEVGTQAYPGPRRQVPTSDADRQRAFLGGYTVGEYKYAPDLPRGETATKQNTAPAKWRRTWTCVKEIPRWIYYLVGFLAALLTCIYLLWWLWTKFSA